MNNKSKKILSEISAGELLDKISILEIKLDKIKDKESIEKINNEYNLLKITQNSSIKISKKLKKLFEQLKKVNLILWDIEDKIRLCEKRKNFKETFIELARNVYFNNDKRSKLKSEINEILGSNIREVKKYTDY